MFDGIFKNRYFLAIMGMEFFMQFVMVQTPGINTGMGCTGLSFGEWFLCILVGASELALNPLVRQVCLPFAFVLESWWRWWWWWWWLCMCLGIMMMMMMMIWCWCWC